MDGKTATLDRTIELSAVSDVSVSSESGNSSCAVQDGGVQNDPGNVQCQPVNASENALARNDEQSPNSTAASTTENVSEEPVTETSDQNGSIVNSPKTSTIVKKSPLDTDAKATLSESINPEIPLIIINESSNEASRLQSTDSTQKSGNSEAPIAETPPTNNPSFLDPSGPRIPTVIITSDSDGLTDDDVIIDKSVLHRLRYDSAGSATSTKLYATAYSYKSDYESSCEDTEALYTAADWTEDSSADVRLDSNVPTIIDVDSSDYENSFGDSDAHLNKSDSSSSLSYQGLKNPLDSNILIDADFSESDLVGECTNIIYGISDPQSGAHHNLENDSNESSCPLQELSVSVERPSEKLISEVRIVVSEEGSELTKTCKEVCLDVGNGGDSIDAHVNHSEEVSLEDQKPVEDQDLKNSLDRDILNDSGISLPVDEYSGASKVEITHSKPPDSSTFLGLSVGGVHIEEDSSKPNGNPSNSSYLIPLEPPCGTEHCHDISRACVHRDIHALDENAVTLLQIARNTGEANLQPSKLQPVCNGGTVKTSNNIKDKLTMRRRREDEREGDEANEELMGAGDRRGSDEVSVGSHFEVRGDEWNIALLLWLYLLQGIPLGLTAAIPMIIQNRGVSFKQQAEFSFAMWPFSLKLLWAPLVDAVYYPSFGRRKTWLVPAQYLIGFFMVFLSFHIDDWLSTDDPHVGLLTLLFFAMNFLAATQDIAVDGWALTMLKRQNRGLASMCNSVGQNAGFFLGYVVFIALESPEFCNKYLRSEPANDGLVTLPGFLYFWGTVYLIMTTLVAFIKREAPESRESPSVRAAFRSYHLLLRILKLPNIQLFAFLLLTCKMGFAAFDGVTSLKFIEKGVPKDKLALVAVPLVPLQILLPILITKMNHPRRPMDLFLKAFPYRLAFNFVGALFVYITPLIIHGNADVPYYFYLMLIAILAIHQGATSAMFVQMMAFFAMVSDADAGGTYMTLLNTLANLGGTWTSTSALAAVDSFTWRSCEGSNLTTTNDCANASLTSVCKEAGGTCVTEIDGYYVEILILTVIGIIWFWYGRRKIDYLQSRPLSSWAVPRR